MSEALQTNLIWGVLLGPLTALFYLLFYMVSAPLRRQERSRFFLDLIETGLRDGRSAEETIMSMSSTGDRSLGVRFHLLAAYLESGWRLVPALQKVGGLVPVQIITMLSVGEELGDYRKVLPACRTLLKDGATRVQSAYTYLILLAFVLVPVMPALFAAMSNLVFPRVTMIFSEITETDVPMPGAELFKVGVALSKIQLGLAAIFYIAAIVYVGGPRFVAWIEAGFPFSLSHPIACWIPWRLKRMKRDFSAMLGLLLDAQVPESRAVELAARSTGNEIFLRRAHRAVRQLQGGTPLPEALAPLDDTGEFQWRLSNAIRSGHNFFNALRGWFEWLDAKAAQQEQSAAHLLGVGLVMFNGVMVAMFVVFVFRGITSIIEAGVLW